jgi:hypothetical protein
MKEVVGGFSPFQAARDPVPVAYAAYDFEGHKSNCGLSGQ